MKDYKVPVSKDEIPEIPGFEKEYQEIKIKKVCIKVYNLEIQEEADELAELLTRTCTEQGARMIHHENKILDNGMCKSFNIWAEY